MCRILVLDGHPHDDRDHFIHALASAYAKGASDTHDVRRIDLAKLDFPVLRDPQDWKTGEVPDGLRAVQDAVGWADHLVILYPMWMGDCPALLKAMFEQIARPGFALEPLESGMYRPKLKGKSARLIVTMGMPASVYALYFRAHSVKSMKRNFLQFAGVSPVRVSLVGMVEWGDSHRRKWLRKVEKLGRNGR